MRKFSRREFMAAVGASAAMAGCARYGADFYDVEGDRKPRVIPPGEKMNVACIGVGGKGKTDSLKMIDENVVALCDVDFENARRIGDVLAAYPDVKRYTDYRKMLTEMDDQIDAVTVTTPDHTHFPAAMMAISMGKHVYVQKPLTRTIWEARELTLAARRHGVATQMGNQHHSDEGPRVLQEMLAADAIGEVHEVHVWTNRPIWPQGIDLPTDRMNTPKSLDWNRWLGTAPVRDYHEAYVPFKWRGWWDFGCGALGDMGCHIVDAPFWALDLGYPTSVEAETSPVNGETFPSWSIVTYKFPKRGSRPPVKLVWYDGGKMPKRPEGLEKGRELSESGGQIYIGDKGTILAGSSCGSPRIIPESKMREFLPNMPPKTIPRSPGQYEEWIAACKGGVPGLSNFDYAGPLTEVVLLGNLAIRYGKKIKFDPVSMTVKNLPEANSYIKPDYRAF